MDQSKNVKAYAAYLEERVYSVRDLSMDPFREGAAFSKKLVSLKFSEGLESQTKILQRLIKSLLETKYFTDSINNEISTESLRLIVKELMRIFTLGNQAVITILRKIFISCLNLEQFFTLSRPDATRALDLYKNFVSQTEKTREFFDFARRLQYGLGIDIPEIKHVMPFLSNLLIGPCFSGKKPARICRIF
jgi:phosphatidylinositol-binding clathrin assembly protein